MKHIPGHNRIQILFFASFPYLAIDQENEVRLKDMFVDSLNPAELGFNHEFSRNE